MSTTLLEFKNLKKYFKTSMGNLHAVDDVSFSIEEGQTLGVVGESGCGKSTLGRAALRLIEPTEGQILFEGNDILKFNRRQMKELRGKMQIIFQDPYSSINPRMTISEIIAEPILVMKKISGKENINRRVLELMDTVGISARLVNAYPHELDGGRRQRVGVARALAVNPKFIVCDEPVSALDVSIQAQILNLMMDLQRDMGLAYMFITHDLSVVKHISKRIAVMYLGQCVELAPSHELFANPLHPYTKALLNAIPMPDINEKGRKRELLKGEVTSPINPQPGCRFAPRCPYASKTCEGAGMAFEEKRAEHFVLCCKVNN